MVLILLSTGAVPLIEGGVTKVTSSGLSVVDLEFREGGQNSSVSLALPNNSLVISAKLEILGRKYREEVIDAFADRSAFIPCDLTNMSLGYNYAMLRSKPFLPAGETYDAFLGWRNATGTAAGDLNGDGAADLAACYLEDGRAGYFPGRSDGSFRAFAEVPWQFGSPVAVAVGDVTGDALADLVVVDMALGLALVFSQNATTHLLNDGTIYSTDFSPMDLVIGDFNFDNLLDVAVCAGYSSACKVDLLLQNSSSHLLSGRSSYSLDTSKTAVSIASGDLDGDSRSDIVAITSDGTLYFLKQQAGGFSSPSVHTVGATCGALAVGDVNGTYPGNEVLVSWVDNSQRQGFSMYYQSAGSLGWGQSVSYPAGLPGQPPRALGAGDADGDGLADVLMGLNSKNEGTLTIVTQSASGGFNPAASVPFPSGSRELTIRDMDGDGRNDVMAACPPQNRIALLWQNSTGVLARREDIRFEPSAMAMGDLNSDKLLDVAVAARYCNQIGVFYMQSSGGYRPLELLGPCNDPVSLGIGKLDGDTLPDLVAVARGNDSLAIFPQTMSGLGSPYYISTGRFPSALAVADVTGDGRADVVVAHSSEKYLSVLSQTAGGELLSDDDYIVGLGQSALAVADLNGDGRTDVAVTVLSSGSVRVLNQTAPGKLESPASYEVGKDPGCLAVCDLDLDRRSDLMVGNAGTPSLSFLVQNSSGGLDRGTDLPLASPPVSVAFGDVDRDDRPEIWMTSRDGNLSLFWQDSLGGVLPPLNYSTEPGQCILALGDLNGDGKLDMGLALPSGSFLRLAPQDFQNGQEWSYPTEASPVYVRAADVNNDRLVDILTASSTHLSVRYQTIGGGLGLRTEYQWSAGMTYNYVSGVAVGDLNSDGWPDVAVTGSYVSTAHIFYGGPSGLATPPAQFNFGTWNYCTGGMCITDVTGDGRADLIRTNYYYSQVQVAAQTASGTLASPVSYATGGLYCDGLAVGDVNGDGRKDLVVSFYYASKISVLAGNAVGSFDSPTSYTTSGYGGAYNNPLVVSDLNGDGRNDVAVVAPATKKLDVFIQQNDGNLAERVSYPVYTSETIGPGMDAGDIDGDGQNELVVSNSNCHNLTIFDQDSAGGLYEKDSYVTGSIPHLVAVTDLNTDGAADIAVVNGGSDSLSVFYQIARRGEVQFPPIRILGRGFLDSLNATWNQTSLSPGSTLSMYVSADGSSWTEVQNATKLSFTKPTTTLHRRMVLISRSSVPIGIRDMYMGYVHSAFPYNPYLDVGGDGSIEWSYSGNFTKKEILTSDILVPELNRYLEAHRDSPGPRVLVPLRIGSSTEGVLEVANISVEYDEPPFLLKPIPADLSIDENGVNNELLDLKEYFADDYDRDLAFEMLDLTNGTIVNVTVLENAWVSVDASWGPSENWSGQVSFRLRMTDSRGLSNTTDLIVVAINPVDQPPLVTSVPVTTATVGSPYTYQVTAVDSEKQPLRFVLEKGPPGMVLNSSSGLLTWLPRVEHLLLPDLDVEILVYDGSVWSLPHRFAIVLTPNLPPVITSSPPISVYLGEDYLYDMAARDPENGTLTFSLLRSPWGMTIDSADGGIFWRPAGNQTGMNDVMIMVSDGYNSVIQNFRVEVLRRSVLNHPPVITSTPPLNATVNEPWSYNVSANDDDNDPLFFYLEPKPWNMTIDGATGRILWIPQANQTGNHTVVVRVSDGRNTTTQLFNIYVRPASEKPQNQTTDISIKSSNSWLFGLVAVVLAAAFAAIFLVGTRRRTMVRPAALARAGAAAVKGGIKTGAEPSPARPGVGAEAREQAVTGKAAGAVRAPLPPAEEAPVVEMLAYPEAETVTPPAPLHTRPPPLRILPPPEPAPPSRQAPPADEYPRYEQWEEMGKGEEVLPVLEPVPLEPPRRPPTPRKEEPPPSPFRMEEAAPSVLPIEAPPPTPRTKEDDIDDIFKLMGVERRTGPAHPPPPPPPTRPPAPPPPEGGGGPAAAPPPSTKAPAAPKSDLLRTLEELKRMQR